MNFDFSGIKKIKIPLLEEEINIESIKKYLPEVLRVHFENEKKIDHYFDYVDGHGQAINQKTRDFLNGTHNNKIEQNHAYYMVSFKEGFLLGDRREFAQKDDSESDDLIYFDRYLSDVSFFSKDVDIKHDIYTCGIGASFIYPRTDIIKGKRFKTKDEGYDLENESPFVYERVDPRYNAVVYTSKIGVHGLGDLFCFNISEEKDELGIKKRTITVYTRKFTAFFDGTNYEQIKEPVETPSEYKMLPIVEHSINNSRIGILEINESLLDGINTLVSNCVDNVVDVVNRIIVFLGCTAGDVKIEDIFEKGMLTIPPANGVQTPDVKTLDVKLSYTDVIVLIQELIARCHDIVGIPITSGSSSGGNNQAAYVGGGWTNALSIIKRDVLALEVSDRELLKRMIAVCKLNPNSKVLISANQIEIKYNVKISDNVLSYTQALQNLVDANMPFEHILKAIPLWGDTKAVAKDWREKVEETLRREQENTEKAKETNLLNAPQENNAG